MIKIYTDGSCLGNPEKISAGTTVELFTDSSYLKNAFTNGWLIKWKRNGWKTGKKSPVLNQDLWMALDELISNRVVKFNWVKGHAGNFFNERCDVLARAAAKKFSVAKISEPSKKISAPKKFPQPKKIPSRGQLNLFDF